MLRLRGYLEGCRPSDELCFFQDALDEKQIWKGIERHAIYSNLKEGWKGMYLRLIPEEIRALVVLHDLCAKIWEGVL